MDRQFHVAREFDDRILETHYPTNEAYWSIEEARNRALKAAARWTKEEKVPCYVVDNYGTLFA
jgi:hypothetical protein